MLQKGELFSDRSWFVIVAGMGVTAGGTIIAGIIGGPSWMLLVRPVIAFLNIISATYMRAAARNWQTIAYDSLFDNAGHLCTDSPTWRAMRDELEYLRHQRGGVS